MSGWIADILTADPEHPSTVVHLDGHRGTVVGWQQGSSIVRVDWHEGGVTDCDEDFLTFTDGALD